MIKSSDRGHKFLPLLLLVPALLLIWRQQPQDIDWRMAVSSYPAADISAAPLLRSDFASVATDLFVHAASVTELDDGRLLSAWFGGSREGASDVNIYGAFFDPATQLWGDNQILASRASTHQAMGRTIRKLGNPVVSQAPDGKLWLFYVSVSLGGWAGSAINASYSNDGGASWTTPTRLITSPFANISTLVKGAPVYYQDGSIGLPVYHEFLGKFAELLRLDADGRVVDKARISHGKHSLQPVVVPSNPNQAVALMRYAGSAPKRAMLSRTETGGQYWPVPHKTTQANPNSALSAVRLEDGSILAVMNDLDDGRHRMGLLRSVDDGENWQLLARLEGDEEYDGTKLPRAEYTPMIEQDFIDSGGPVADTRWQSYSERLDKRVCDDDMCRFIYDYPFLIRGKDGTFHLVYTWNKSFIKHLQFNRTWLDTLL
jgi:predicted neuraminidase